MSIADKLTQIAENEQKVFDSGAKSEHDRFWDSYQKKGNRTAYERGFQGYGFDFNNLFPKYDIKPVGSAERLFYAWEQNQSTQSGSLKTRLEECDVILDTSGCTNATHMFGYCRYITELPTLDFTGLTAPSSNVFTTCSALHTIEKIIVGENVTSYSSWFRSCSNLENIVFEGSICRAISFSDCKKLTHDSLMSIINALQDKSTDTSGTEWNLTLGGANLAKLTEDEIEIAENKGWSII